MNSQDITQAMLVDDVPPDPSQMAIQFVLFNKNGVPIKPWQKITLAEYDALTTPDPNVLYVVVG
jgi:hypothetical protein